MSLFKKNENRNNVNQNRLVSGMIKIEYPKMVPLARRIQRDTKRFDSDKLIRRMKK